MKQGFSILMSVYERETVENLRQCLQSLTEQSLPAAELVLVEDGPLGGELPQCIEDFRAKLNIVSVRLEGNMGLGAALNRGLEACGHEWVARMDTDDIADPCRFEKQFRYLAEHRGTDILGTWIQEFSGTPSHPTGKRSVPCDPLEISSFAKFRSPLNHMTVIFRKAAVQQAGGYPMERGLEDYDLWVRCLLSGAVIANLPECLVFARADHRLMERRGGLRYAWWELRLIHKFWRWGFFTWRDVLLQTPLRLTARLSPHSLRRQLYHRLLRKPID